MAAGGIFDVFWEEIFINLILIILIYFLIKVVFLVFYLNYRERGLILLRKNGGLLIGCLLLLSFCSIGSSYLYNNHFGITIERWICYKKVFMSQSKLSSFRRFDNYSWYGPFLTGVFINRGWYIPPFKALLRRISAIMLETLILWDV